MTKLTVLLEKMTGIYVVLYGETPESGLASRNFPRNVGEQFVEDNIGTIVAGLVGAVLLITCIPLALGKIGRNRWYGYRIKATMNDDRVWYPVNERTGRQLAITALVLLVLCLVGLVALDDPEQQELLLILDIGVMTIGLAWSIATGWSMSKELTTKNREADASKDREDQ